MEYDEPQPDSLEIKTFLPSDVELIDPYRQLPPEFQPQPPRRRSRKRLAVILFAITCVTTFLAGTVVGDPRGSLLGFVALWKSATVGLQVTSTAELLANGLIYSGALLLTLVAHEMGHYLQAVRYGVPASPPFFIPFPIGPFGTMGAVIVQGAGVADRKQMFDIAISGPLAGLVLALPITWFGIQQAEIKPVVPSGVNTSYGDPLVVQWMVTTIHRPLGPNEDIKLTPLLFAGWVGIFVTALNLIPIGQLDGGHVLYMLIGRRAHPVAMLMLWGGVGYMVYTGNYSYVLIAILMLIFGPRHPPTADDSVPLGLPRIILGWVTLGFVIIGFTPIPIKDHRDAAKPRPAPRRNAEPPGGPLAAGALLSPRSEISMADDEPRCVRMSAREPICVSIRVAQHGHPPRGVRPWHPFSTGHYLSQRDFMNASAPVARCSSEGNIGRQIFVAAARSGSVSPNASTTIQPS